MIDTKVLIDIVKGAGIEILKFYHKTSPSDVVIKEDGSPLTLADQASHNYICLKLKESFSWPIVSEEDPIEYDMRKNWETFWLIDPLDGTKDFIAANDEFTVNIALIHKNEPVFGIIYAPALGETYYAEKGKGAYVLENGKAIKLPNKKCEGLIAGKSRFHDSEGNNEFLKINQITKANPYGSSLKFGKLASGEISVYPRFVGSSEWDIAAGQIIVIEAECTITDLKTFKEPVYNKPSIRNNFFIACSKDVNFTDLKIPKDTK